MIEASHGVAGGHSSPSDRALGTVVVLYHPDAETLDHIDHLVTWGYSPIVVVNGADASIRLRLQDTPGLVTIENQHNLGIAKAFNQGIEYALARGDAWVLLFDQDSRPAAGFAGAMLAAAERAASTGPLGCIGPTLMDRKRPTATMRARGRQLPGEFRMVLTLISSGMLIPRQSIESVGGMWNELFIDGVDHEWCFRAAAARRQVLMATDVALWHDLGDDGLTVFGRYKPIHRSPVRHYHIARNTLWLSRCSFIPLPWRISETLKLALRAPAYLLFSSAKGTTARLLWRGIRDGLRRPPGRTLHS